VGGGGGGGVRVSGGDASGFAETGAGQNRMGVGMAAGRVLFEYNNTRPEIVPETSTNIHTHQVNRARNYTRTHAHRVSTGYRVSSGYVIVD
jgi:hypothetical protein